MSARTAQGTVRPIRFRVLNEDGSVRDVSGETVILRLRPRQGSAVDVEATPETDGTDGWCLATNPAAAFAVPGTCEAQVLIDPAGPNDYRSELLPIEVFRSL